MARREASRPDPSRNRPSSGARGDRDRSRLKVEPEDGWGACGPDHEESSPALDVERQTVEDMSGEERHARTMQVGVIIFLCISRCA